MDPVSAAALIGAGVKAADTISQGKMNRKTRQFTEDMYNKQRADNLTDWNSQNAYSQQMWNMQNQYNENRYAKERADKLSDWERQNEYDSPAAQMARYKAAGINPHAIYGNMSGGASMDATAMANASAPSTSAPSKTSAGGWSPQPLSFDFLQNMAPIIGARKQAAETDNLKAQNRLIEQETILKSLETFGKQLSNNKLGMENSLLKNTWHNSVQAADLNIQKLKQDLQYSSQANDRANTATQLAINKDNRELRLNEKTLDKMTKDMHAQAIDNNIKLVDKEWKRLEMELKQKAIHMQRSGQLNSDNIDGLIKSLLGIVK